MRIDRAPYCVNCNFKRSRNIITQSRTEREHTDGGNPTYTAGRFSVSDPQWLSDDHEQSDGYQQPRIYNGHYHDYAQRLHKNLKKKKLMSHSLRKVLNKNDATLTKKTLMKFNGMN